METPYPVMSLTKQYAINNVVPILYGPLQMISVLAGSKLSDRYRKFQGEQYMFWTPLEQHWNNDNTMTTLEPDVIVAGTGFHTGIRELCSDTWNCWREGGSKISGDQEFKKRLAFIFIRSNQPS